MKPKFSLRAFVFGTIVLTAQAQAQSTLYWDGGTGNIAGNGNGVSGGTAGNWDTTLTNWDQGSGLAYVAWDNTNTGPNPADIAVFGGTAGTVTLNAPITVGGLNFYSTSGYLINAGSQGLTFGATNNTIRMVNSSGGGATSSATIQGTVGGPGNLILTSIATDVASTLNLTGTSTAGWSGTTTINANATLSLSGLNQGLVSTSGITLNGGGITLTSADDIAQDDLDRVNDAAAISSNGGTITYTTTTAGSTKNFIETIGSVTLSRGQLNLVNTLDKSAGSQTLALAGLTHTGTSAITFSNAGGLNTTNDIIRVNGITTSTTGGQIIGPWATVGTGAAAQTDYAVYNSDTVNGRVVAANITANNTESTWGSAANIHLSATTTTLGATRTLNSLRYSAGAGSLTLGTSNFNLETYGILNGGSGLLTIQNGTGGTGGLTTPTGGGNLYLTTGNNAITVSAPINNNSGNVTLVKSGSGTLTLSSTTSNYSGGTVLNAGTLAIGTVTNIGGASAGLTFNGTATLAPSAGLNFSTGTLTVNEGAYGSITGNAATAFGTTTGAGTLRYTASANSQSLNLGNASGFTGTLQVRINNPDYGATNGLQFSSLGDGVGSAIQFSGGSGDSNQNLGIAFNGGSPLTFNNRAIEFVPRTSSNWNVSVNRIANNSATANIWTINTDLINNTDRAATFELAGNNTGNNIFAGRIGNSTLGTLYNGSNVNGVGALSLTKSGGGTWILGGNNTYTGATSISGGVLRITKNTSLGTTAGGVTQSGTSALEIDGTGGAVIVGAEAISINGGGISNGGAIRNIAGDNTYGGTVTLAAQSRINSDSGTLLLNNATAIAGVSQNLVVGGAGNVTISGAITSTGTVTKDGAGTLTLSGPNIYTGKTIVGNGTLSFSAGDASATADQQLGKNAALDLGVAATSSGRLLYTGGAGTLAKNINAIGNGTDTIENGGSGLLTLTGTLTKNGTVLTLKGGANGITVSGAGTIAGSNANSDLIVDGGVVTLATANTYNGPTFIINGATLNANATNALPTSINRTAVSMDQTGSGSSTLAMSVNQSIASLSGAASSTVNLNANTLTIGSSTGNTTFAGVISGIGGSLIKDGASIQTLTNTNTYDGTTSITGGILRVNGSGSLSTGAVNVSAGALGGAGGTINGAVTLSGTGGMNLVAGTVGDLTLNSTLNITGSAGANSLNFDLGSAAGGADKIIVSGAPTVTNNGVVVGFNQIGGNAARINAGTYTIIQGSTAPTLANYSLATTRAFGNTYALQVTGNNLEVVTTQAAAGDANVHWSGSTNTSWGTLNNWRTNVAGNVVAGSVPAYNTNVTFGTTTPGQTNLNTTLGADFNINSLTFTIPAAGGITVGGSNMLTLESSGTAITSSNTSGTNTISANVGMAASQSWSVNTGGTLAVSGNITDFGVGRTLTKTGAGTLTLSGNNTYSGGTTLSVGTLNINNGGSSSDNSAIGTGTFTISGGTINNTAGAASSTVTLLTNNALALNADFTYTGTGSRNLNLGTGAVTMAATRQITVSAGNLTIGGNIASTAAGITKAGAGTLTLTGNNYYTGATTISAGTVVLNNDGDVTGSTVTFNGSNSGLTITGGSSVTSIWNNNGGAFGGSASASQNNVQVLIDGAGTEGSARLTNVTNLNWGGNFGGANSMTNSTLSLTNGGQMTVSGEVRTGSTYYQTGGGANISIGGGSATSTFTGNSGQAFYIGFGDREGANNNVVTVSSNGVLTGIGNMILGQVNNTQGAGGVATANRLTVTGTGTASMLSVTIGYAQSGDAQGSSNANVVQVTNGGTLTTSSGTNYIGRNAITAGATTNANTATVTGTGSTWNASNQNIIVGSAAASTTANNNILTVELGGLLSNVGALTVGSTTGTSTGNEVRLNGGGTINATTITVSAGNTLRFGNGGTTSGLSQTGDITNNGSMVFNLSDTITQGTNFDDAFGGSGSVNQIGSGILILNGTNSYTGTTTIQSGTLVAGANAPSSGNGAFGGSAGGAIVLGNATTGATSAPSLLINADALSVGRDITVGTGATTAYNATIGGSNTTGTATFSGNITLIAGGSYTTTLQAATGGTVNFTSGTWDTNNKEIRIGSSGNTGTVRLSNSIATSGGISLNFGTLQLNSAFTGGNMTVASGTILSGTGSVAGTTGVTSATVNGTGLVLSGATTFNSTGNTLSGTVTTNASLASSAALALNGALTGNMTVGDGTLSGTGSVSGTTGVTGGTVNGTALTLTGATTFNSTGNILSGTVTSTAGVSLASSAALALNGALTGNMTVGNGTLSGTGSVSGTTGVTGGTINGGTGFTLTGLTTFNSTGNILSGTVTSTAGVSLASSAALALNGALTGTLAIGDGTLTGTAGSVSGAATLNGGTINLTSGSFGSTLGVTGGNWDGAGSVTGAVTSSSGTFTIGSSGNLTTTGGLIVTGGALGGTGTITGSVDYSSTADSTFDGIIAGSGNTLTKSGSSTFTLTGANTYTGATVVNGGVLELASGGSTASGSAVSVSGTGSTVIVNGTVGGTLTTGEGTFLSGSGTITGNAIVSGTHNPGNSPGVQVFEGDLSYVAPDVSVTWELIANDASALGRGTNYDGIDVGGDLDFEDPTVINLVFNLGGSGVLWTDNFWASNQSWVLYDYTGGSLTNLSNLSVVTANWQDGGSNAFNDSIRAGGTFTVSNSGTTVLLNYTAIPEPSTALLSVIGALALLRRRR